MRNDSQNVFVPQQQAEKRIKLSQRRNRLHDQYVIKIRDNLHIIKHQQQQQKQKQHSFTSLTNVFQGPRCFPVSLYKR